MKKNKDKISWPETFKSIYTSVYPGIFQKMKELEVENRVKPMWPDWCLISGDAVFKAFASLHPKFEKATVEVEQNTADQITTSVVMNTTTHIMAAYAWNKGKNIFKFDSTLSDELRDMQLDRVPTDVLGYLPDWCPYLDFSDNPISEFTGAFAFHQKVEDADEKVLTLVFTYNDPNIIGDVVCLLLGNYTIQESVVGFLTATSEERETTIEVTTAVLNHLIYLCSTEKDVVNHNPYEHKKISGFSSQISPKVNQWDVGFRVGSIIRKYIAKENSKEITGNIKELNSDDEQASASLRNRPRPHVRRAHWHHFWTKSVGARVLIVKWLPPTFINSSDEEDLPSVLHRVLVSKEQSI